MVGTIPEKGSQEGAPPEVVAYFGEDVSTAMAWFTLAGPKGELEGELAYYSESPCEPEGPSCFHWHFIPYDPLTTGQYTAEVFGVTDRAGLGMEAPYAWSFEVTDGIGGELLAPPAAGPQAEEGGEPAAAAGPAAAAEPAEVPETVEPAAEEEPLAAPAGEGGEIESGTPGVLYVRKTSYYYFGGQRVAMRQVDTWGGDVVYYLLSDHLGTTSLVLDGAGNRVAESRHYPYGAVRWTWTADGSGTLPTDYRFTGQRDVGLGLTHMGARFLDTSLGRWVSPDTLVPNPQNPQSLNRFSYTRNNPVKYRDPSGHIEIYGGSYAPYSDYWHTYVNPNAPGCQSDLEFIKQGASLAVDFTPGVGDAKGFAEVFTGRDLLTGESLGNWRWLGLIGLSEVRHLRHADEALAGVMAFGKIAEGLDTIFHDIRPFTEFASPRLPPGWHAHHLVEKRFWRQLGFGSFEEGRDNILSVMVPSDFHLADVTSAIRRLIPNTDAATLQDIWNAHKQVYMQYEWGEDWLDTIWDAYFAGTDVVQ